MVAKSMELSWIVVKDLDQAITFYTEVVGLELQEKNDLFGWAELTAPEGAYRLGLARSSGMSPMEAGSNAIVTFNVDDIVAAKAAMAEKGATFEGEIMEVPGHVKLQLFVDSDGNKGQLVQEL